MYDCRLSGQANQGLCCPHSISLLTSCVSQNIDASSLKVHVIDLNTMYYKIQINIQRIKHTQDKIVYYDVNTPLQKKTFTSNKKMVKQNCVKKKRWQLFNAWCVIRKNWCCRNWAFVWDMCFLYWHVFASPGNTHVRSVVTHDSNLPRARSI